MTNRDLATEFRALEEQFAAAIFRKDAAELDRRWLAADYELRVADAPQRHISRADWLGMIPIYNTRSYEIRDFKVREVGAADAGSAVVTSLVVQQDADVNGVDRSGDFFIVDIWARERGEWKVTARYSSPQRALPKMLE